MTKDGMKMQGDLAPDKPVPDLTINHPVQGELTEMERKRMEDPLFIEHTRPEDPSGRPGQQTRDNVNPHIPSGKLGDPPNSGGIVDPRSLGMDVGGGVAPAEPVQQGFEGLPPDHFNSSINEPPGSTVMTGSGGLQPPGGETAPPDETAPVIEGLEPDEAEVGGPDVTLHVTGTGFTQGSTIQFGTGDIPTTFVDDGELTAEIKPSEWSEGVVPVRVKLSDGGLKSEEAEFEFVAPDTPATTRKRTKKHTKRGR